MTKTRERSAAYQRRLDRAFEKAAEELRIHLQRKYIARQMAANIVKKPAKKAKPRVKAKSATS